MYKIKKELDFSLTTEEKYVLTKLFEVARIEHKELYIVGGAIRNVLLGKEPKDIDLCTNATPKEVIKIVDQYDNFKDFEVIETGIKHGTVTLYHKRYKCSFELTTFRVDGIYEDHRRPDEVTFTRSLEEDLKRRDLTINSFAYNFYTKELIMLDEDYLSDLELGIIRTVGKPEDRFNEDALRMLRAIRFAAQFGFTIEEETFEAIKKLSSTLEFISKERIRDELTKILLSDQPECLKLIISSRLGKYCLPEEILSLESCKQHNKYHYMSALEHTIDVIKLCDNDLELRFAALLHDIGKPDCINIDDTGYEHYYSHSDKSFELVKQILLDYKLSNVEQANILTLVKYLDVDFVNISKSKFKKLLNEIGIELFPKFIKLRVADIYSHNLFQEDDCYIKSISRAKQFYKQIINDGDCLTIKDLAVDGYDLIKLGYSGKKIGEALKYCLDIVLEEPELNVKETLITLIKDNFSKNN